MHKLDQMMLVMMSAQRVPQIVWMCQFLQLLRMIFLESVRIFNHNSMHAPVRTDPASMIG